MNQIIIRIMIILDNTRMKSLLCQANAHKSYNFMGEEFKNQNRCEAKNLLPFCLALHSMHSQDNILCLFFLIFFVQIEFSSDCECLNDSFGFGTEGVFKAEVVNLNTQKKEGHLSSEVQHRQMFSHLEKQRQSLSSILPKVGVANNQICLPRVGSFSSVFVVQFSSITCKNYLWCLKFCSNLIWQSLSISYFFPSIVVQRCS